MSKERKGKAPVKIVMLRTELGQDQTAEGVAHPQKRYLRGETHVVGASLAATFVQMGAAKVDGEKPAETPATVTPPAEEKPEVSAKKGAPENKAKKGSPEKKGA